MGSATRWATYSFGVRAPIGNKGHGASYLAAWQVSAPAFVAPFCPVFWPNRLTESST